MIGSTRARRAGVLAAALTATLVLAACGDDGDAGGGGGDEKPIVGLITKTDTNPFFVKMKEGAQKAATEAGVTLQTFAGKQDGDNEAQVQAIESLISAGAKGILITPSDSKAIVPSIDKAKQAGMLVIALDTPTDPADAVDATFATDNYQAGLLIGQWAKAKMAGKPAKIAMLDLNANQVSVDVQRDQGFLEGFGIDVKDKNQIGDESDPQIVGHDVTDGAEDGGRTAMENLLQKDPSINLVYTINEPAAAGAYQALKAAGKEKHVTIVSVDGGCPGVDAVKAGAARRDLPAVPAEDGRGGRRGRGRVRQGRHQAGGDRGQDLHRHRRHADHRPAADRRRVEGHHVRHRELLGLTDDRHPLRRRDGHRDGSRARRTTSTSTAPSRSACASSTSCTRSRPSVRSPCWSWRSSPSRCCNGRFLSAANLSLVLAQVTVIAVLALGQTLIILTAGIDLSVGAIAVFSSILMAKFATDAGVPGPLALLLGFVLGTAMGCHQRHPGHPASSCRRSSSPSAR